MRKTMLILSLVGATALANANDACAQFRLFGGGWGYGPGISIGLGRGGYDSPNGYNNGMGYSPYYQNYGNAYQFAPSDYNSTLGYNLQPQIRQSFYPANETPKGSASMAVLVPVANAQVWFDGAATKQQGMDRMFHSPTLEPNHKYAYTIKARWTENGKTVNQERQVNVQAGQNITVNFREPISETVPLPQTPDTKPRE